MSSVPSSSPAITPFSKQQTDIITDNGNINKLDKLKQKIMQLENQKKEYLMTNKNLTQNADLICQKNKILKDAINKRKTHYEQILDQYLRSTRTLQTATENNKKMSKIYQRYKARAINVQKINDNSLFFSKENEKFGREIKDAQKSANELIKKFHESEKKIYDYKILISLNSRLINVNKLFTKEAKNCISEFSTLQANNLQQKVDKGDEIKMELSLFNFKEENEKIQMTKYALKNFSEKLDHCLLIFNQIVLINRMKCMMNEDDFDDFLFSDENLKSPSSDDTIFIENVESKFPKEVEFDAEISELQRIVGKDDFEYINGPERKERNRRIKSSFIPGINADYFGGNSSYKRERHSPPNKEKRENAKKQLKNENFTKHSEKVGDICFAGKNHEKDEAFDELEKENQSQPKKQSVQRHSKKVGLREDKETNTEKVKPIENNQQEKVKLNEEQHALHVECDKNHREEIEVRCSQRRNDESNKASEKFEQSEKVAGTDQKEESKKSANNDSKPLLAHQEQKQQQADMKSNQQKSREFITEELKDDQSEKVIATEKSIHPNSQPQEGKSSKQQSNAEPSKKSDKSPYPASSHPSKGRLQAFAKRHQISIMVESEEASEYVLEIPEDVKQSVKSNLTKKRLLPNDQNIKPEQKLKPESLKPPGIKSSEPNDSNKKTVEESAFASDCILEELEEKSEYMDFASCSGVSFNFSRSGVGARMKQAEKTEQQQQQQFVENNQKTTDKNTQIPFTTNIQTTTEESQKTSDEDASSEKAIVTEKFLLPKTQIQEDVTLSEINEIFSCEEEANAKQNEEETEFILKIDGKQAEEANELSLKAVCSKLRETKQPNTSTDSTHLTEDKKRKQGEIESKEQTAEEQEQAAEYTLKISGYNPSEKVTVTDKTHENIKLKQPAKTAKCSPYFHPNKNTKQLAVADKPNPPQNQTQENIKSMQRATTTHSVQVNPFETFTKMKQISIMEESEQASEHILQVQKEQKQKQEQTEKASQSIHSNSNQTNKSKQQENAEQSRMPVTKSRSPQIHPSKSTQLTHAKNDLEEKEHVLKILEDQSEMFILPNDQTKEFIKLKQAKTSKQSAKSACSIQKKTNKNTQQSFTMNIQTETTEGESQPKSSDYTSEKAIVTEKFFLPKTQVQEEPSLAEINEIFSLQEEEAEFILKVDEKKSEEANKPAHKSTNSNRTSESDKAKHPGIVEQPKLPVKRPNSLQVHPNKSRQQAFTKKHQTSIMNEPEEASEYVLEIPEEKQEIYTSPTKPNKNQKQADIKSSQQMKEESEQAAEFVLKVSGYNHSVKTPTKRSMRSKQPANKEAQQSAINDLYSLLMNPAKSQQAAGKSKERIQTKSEETAEFVLKIDDKQTEEEASKVTCSKSNEILKTKQPNTTTNSTHSIEDKKRKQAEIKSKEQAAEYTLKVSGYNCTEKATVTDKTHENIKSKQPAKTAKCSPYLHQNKNSKQPFTKKRQISITQEAEEASEYVLEIPKEASIVSKKSTPPKVTHKNARPLVSEMMTEELDELEEQEERLKEELKSERIIDELSIFDSSTKKTKKKKQEEDAAECRPLELEEQIERWYKSEYMEFASSSEKLFNSSRSSPCSTPKQAESCEQPLKAEYSLLEKPEFASEYRLAELQEQIEKWSRSEYMEFASSSEKLFNSSFCSTPKQAECVPPLFAKEEPDSRRETTEENSSEKAIVTQKFLLCNLQPPKGLISSTSSTTTAANSSSLHPKKPLIDYQPLSEDEEEDNDDDDEFLLDELDSENEKCQSKAQKKVKKKTLFENNKRRVFFKDEAPMQTHLIVSLKDIGLEGFDSSNIEKIRELRRLQLEQKNNSRILIRVDDFGERNHGKVEPFSNSEVVCKLSLCERKEKPSSSRKKAEQIDPCYRLFSLPDEQVGSASNPKPVSLLDLTQKAQKTQAIKPKTAQKNSSKCNKQTSVSFGNSFNESQLNARSCKSPRRLKDTKNDSDEGKEFVLY